MNETLDTDAIGPVVFINKFILKPGIIDEFVALQKVNLERSRGNVPGWRGSRLHRATDGRTAMMISTFDTIAYHKRVHHTEGFAEHTRELAPLIETVEPGYYQFVHEVIEK